MKHKFINRAITLLLALVCVMGLLPLSASALAFLSALLEISCGADQTAALSTLPDVYRAAFVCTGAAFGGLCICAQTQSVLTGTPLSVGTWLKGRVVIALAVFLLTPLAAAAPVLPGCW